MAVNLVVFNTIIYRSRRTTFEKRESRKGYMTTLTHTILLYYIVENIIIGTYNVSKLDTRSARRKSWRTINQRNNRFFFGGGVGLSMCTHTMISFYLYIYIFFYQYFLRAFNKNNIIIIMKSARGNVFILFARVNDTRYYAA